MVAISYESDNFMWLRELKMDYELWNEWNTTDFQFWFHYQSHPSIHIVVPLAVWLPDCLSVCLSFMQFYLLYGKIMKTNLFDNKNNDLHEWYILRNATYRNFNA